MNDSMLEPNERARMQLRAAIAEVELQVSGLAKLAIGGGCAIAAGALTGSWQKLMPLIAPEPEPERRPCEHCRGRIMRAATRCMYCLKTSIPPQAEH